MVSTMAKLEPAPSFTGALGAFGLHGLARALMLATPILPPEICCTNILALSEELVAM